MMSFDFNEFLRTYNSNGEDDDDAENGLLNLNLNCDYYDVDDLKQIVTTTRGNRYRYLAIHLNIHSLASKYDQLRTLLSDLHDSGIHINFILLCETFLTGNNASMFPLPGYHFICKNRNHGRGGGVAMYISENFDFKLRDDLMIYQDQEFESIFAEVTLNEQKLIVGEIYRVPNTNEQLAIQRYDQILQQLTDFSGNVLIGTDQNFNYFDIERHGNTRDLLNTFITAGFIPTITKATRITYNSATLIDNIYTKYKPTDHLTSGLIISDISDHLPVFMLLGKPAGPKKRP